MTLAGFWMAEKVAGNPNSPSLAKSMSASACCRTTSVTSARGCREKSGDSEQIGTHRHAGHWVREVRAQVANYKRFKSLSTQWVALSIERCRLRMKLMDTP